MIRNLAGLLVAMTRSRLDRPDRPRFLTYTVTFGCNARCIMCDSWKMSSRGDLTLDEIDSIFQQLPRLDAVRLTGGEPFARRDMVEIAQQAVQHLKPMVLHVTTNGFLTDRIVDFCERRPRRTPLELLISMDGVGEKHNQIRGKADAWDRCMETIAALADRRQELRLNISVNQTIVDAEGAEHYGRLRDELQKFQIRNQIVIAYDVSATYNLEKDVNLAPKEAGQFSTYGEFTEEQILRLIDTVEQDVASYPYLQRVAKRYYLKGIRNRLLNNTGRPNPRCVSMNSHLRIFPNGDVPTCQFNSRVVGNLRKQSFEDIWYGAEANAQRDWVRRCAGCWAECEVLPNAVYSGDLLEMLVR